MNNINDTIELLKKIILDPHCSRMNLSTVKGYLGELIVKAKLESEEVRVKHLGNQSGYDLEVISIGEVFKIDVKFSAFKREYHSQQDNWGWALIHGNKQRQISCTHIVCVAVDHALDVVNYYVIPKQHIELFPPGAGRFRRVKHSFLLFGDDVPNSQERWSHQFEISKQLLESAKVVQVRSNGNLFQALSLNR